ncbi:MAG: PilZ domain-containing protein [Hyphomonas sp.]|uniref:PilZ domain-containing protein n=1 Tax=Hyphomonas sp. TaxID=87 RepID=UPI003529BDD8
MTAATNQNYELRSDSRVETEFCAWFMPGDSSMAQKVKVLDLSQGGARLQFENWPDRSKKFDIVLSLPEGLNSSRIACERRWMMNNVVGAKFLSPLPFDVLSRIVAFCDGTKNCAGPAPDPS